MELSAQDILFIIAGVLNIIGIIGALVPALPGPPLSFAGMVLCCIATPNWIMVTLSIMTLIMVVGLAIIDYLAPGWMANKAGGSKKSIWGANIGLVVGLFYAPWGLIIGPFLGALVGELIENNDFKRAVKIAAFTICSILLSSMFKLIACLIIFIICIIDASVYYLN